jgi:hypothetical protein
VLEVAEVVVVGLVELEVQVVEETVGLVRQVLMLHQQILVVEEEEVAKMLVEILLVETEHQV